MRSMTHQICHRGRWGILKHVIVTNGPIDIFFFISRNKFVIFTAKWPRILRSVVDQWFWSNVCQCIFTTRSLEVRVAGRWITTVMNNFDSLKKKEVVIVRLKELFFYSFDSILKQVLIILFVTYCKNSLSSRRWQI